MYRIHKDRPDTVAPDVPRDTPEPLAVVASYLEDEEPAPRRRPGRPKGSKNKPKVPAEQ